ncbi:acetolactate synthase 3, chloroplastic isoform X1 [Selaginella moellendorffii]|uniref:acetolactate synthase 3, chloroplastic isoform X1 n=1 Tax=Selaginella moellendorffii TaxID=88036 RepID=UPI000D1C3BB9|nr:acetolactate synthase 3, chloroplastic isoform X1 [Selaginella moellendorffii]|eukprot:XP_024519482.1 acetolactate synthase 3, chloroplastic isoform X1 [Selaginella moellendorffii]
MDFGKLTAASERMPRDLLTVSSRRFQCCANRPRRCVNRRYVAAHSQPEQIASAGAGNGSPALTLKLQEQKQQQQLVSMDFQSRYGATEPRKGCDVLVEALERQGVDVVFAYPGGASMEIHQALTRSTCIRNILCRHEQGEIFAAEGYAKSSGKVGVCIATSGPGATNLVTGLADALLDSVPLVAITGQVPRRMIGTDAFQETPIVEVTRSITKHNYLVMNVEDIPRVIKEAFFLASSGRPGPVLVDIPKDIQQQFSIPDWSQKMKLDAYVQRLPPRVSEPSQLEQVLRLIQEAKRPVIYCGGGCIDSSEEVREFVEETGIPLASTLMGLGVFPQSDERCLQMLGMHGTVYANYAIDSCDLLLAFGVRFDDRVTGKLEMFARRASIVHVDIDSAEIGKNKQPHISIWSDVKPVLRGLNRMLKSRDMKLDFSAWRDELQEQKQKFPLTYPCFDNDCIVPQYAIRTLAEITQGNAIISTGVGQHQMWAAQWCKHEEPRRWLTSGGLGAMGFGLPAALGAAAASPGIPVVDIDGDGSFIMNIQELATIHVEKLPVKIMVLNNQHLGMVVQWEDRFYKANRAHTYLGDPDAEAEIYPDFRAFCSSNKEIGPQGSNLDDASNARPLSPGRDCSSSGACIADDTGWCVIQRYHHRRRWKNKVRVSEEKWCCRGDAGIYGPTFVPNYLAPRVRETGCSRLQETDAPSKPL